MLKFLPLVLLPGMLPSLLPGFLGLKATFGLGTWQPVEELNLAAVDIRPVWESAWVKKTIANDPTAKAIVSDYLSGLSAAGYQTELQGVWIAAGLYPIAQNEGSQLRPAASLTKIATTLAALSTWGPDHRFDTLVGWQGQLENGVIVGDLVIEGGGDPLFVWEEAIALASALQQMGIRQVTGDVIIAGDFTMNFDPSPSRSGRLLKQAFNATEWDYVIEAAYQNLPLAIPKPTVQIEGAIKTEPSSRKNSVSGWLIRHQSLPLVAVLKAMNIYSNNAMAEQLANSVGGVPAVIEQAEKFAGVIPGELVLVNGSGLGEENQMSPRAAVAMFRQVQTVLRASDLTISDIFPIAGSDGGTISDRAMPDNTVVKTGTLAVVSALAGALPTRDKGIVWFSLINYGSDLDALRRRQDLAVSDMEQRWGKADIPPALKTTVRIGEPPYQLGDRARNQAISQ
ncbi:MAG: D-alanyl-D-alanine carboxypeptidase [Phormidesmis sp.]